MPRSSSTKADKGEAAQSFRQMAAAFVKASQEADARLAKRESELVAREERVRAREIALGGKESEYVRRIEQLTSELYQQIELQKQHAEETEARFREATNSTVNGLRALDISPSVSRTTSLQRDSSVPKTSSVPAASSGRSQSPGASRLDGVYSEQPASPTSERSAYENVPHSPNSSTHGSSSRGKNAHKYREGELSMEDSRYVAATQMTDDLLAHTVHNPRVEELSSSSDASQDTSTPRRRKQGIQGRPDFVPMDPEDSGLDFFREGVSADARRRLERELASKGYSGDDEEYGSPDPPASPRDMFAATATMGGSHSRPDHDHEVRLSPQDKQVVEEDNFDDTSSDSPSRRAQNEKEPSPSRRQLFTRGDHSGSSASEDHNHRGDPRDGQYESDSNYDENPEAAELEERFAEAVEWLIASGHVRDEQHVAEIIQAGNTPEDIIQWREDLGDEEGEELDEYNDENPEEETSDSQQHPTAAAGVEAVHVADEDAFHLVDDDSRPTTHDRQLLGSSTAGHDDSVSDAEEDEDDHTDNHRPRTAYGTRPSRLNGGSDYLQHHHIGSRIGGVGRLGGGGNNSPTQAAEGDHHDDEDDGDMPADREQLNEAASSLSPHARQRLRVANFDETSDEEEEEEDQSHNQHADPFADHVRLPHDDSIATNDDRNEEATPEEHADSPSRKVHGDPMASSSSVGDGQNETDDRSVDNDDGGFIHNEFAGGSTTSSSSAEGDTTFELPDASSPPAPMRPPTASVSQPSLPSLNFGGMKVAQPTADSASSSATEYTNEDDKYSSDDDDPLELPESPSPQPMSAAVPAPKAKRIMALSNFDDSSSDDDE